jgi:hypothetical protein
MILCVSFEEKDFDIIVSCGRKKLVQYSEQKILIFVQYGELSEQKLVLL